MTQPKPDVFSIALASAAAVGHVNAGISEYGALQKYMNECKASGTECDGQKLWQLVIPATSNLAFGLEISLKIYHFQHTLEYPEGHDIGKLGLAIPAAGLAVLRSQFLVFSRDPAITAGMVMFDLARGPDFEPKERVLQRERPATYDAAVRQIGAAYVRWRYIYERFGGDGTSASIDFLSLRLLIESVRYGIDNFKGRGRVGVTVK